MVCGIILLNDILKWILKQEDLFDPMVCIALIGFHAFFIAPILHLRWDIITGELYFKEDWKYWIGIVVLINLAGICVYKITHIAVERIYKNRIEDYRLINKKRFYCLLIIIASVSLISQIYIYLQFSGVEQYLEALSEGAANLNGKGWLLVLADPFPLVITLGVIVYLKEKNVGYILIYILLILFFLLQIFWNGFRGSRSALMYPLIIAASFVHYYLRRFTIKEIVSGMLIIVLFLYIYAFYKELRWYSSVDFSIQSALTSSEYRKSIEKKTGRTKEGVLLGDLARNDVQAKIAEVVIGQSQEYKEKNGETYLGAISLLIPGSVWMALTGSQKLGGKSKRLAFQEILLNNLSPGIFGRERLPTRIYALTGEALMNFGLNGVIAAHFLFGLIVGLARSRIKQFKSYDARKLYTGIIAVIILHVLFLDLSNVIWFIFRQCFLLVFILNYSICRIPKCQTRYI